MTTVDFGSLVLQVAKAKKALAIAQVTKQAAQLAWNNVLLTLKIESQITHPMHNRILQKKQATTSVTPVSQTPATFADLPTLGKALADALAAEDLAKTAYQTAVAIKQSAEKTAGA